MVSSFYVLSCLFLLIGCVWLTLKILDWYKEYKINKFQTNLHHFLFDLHKLNQKWMSAGEFAYSESLNNLINLYGKIDKKTGLGSPGMPFSADIASAQEALRNNKKEEISNIFNEIVNEM